MNELESSRKSKEFYDWIDYLKAYYGRVQIICERFDFTFVEYMKESDDHFRESANKPMVFTSI